MGGACLLWLSHKRERPLLKVVAHHIEPGWRGDGRPSPGARPPAEKFKVISNWANRALITPLPLEESALHRRMETRRSLRGRLRGQSRSCPRRRHVLAAMTLLQDRAVMSPADLAAKVMFLFVGGGAKGRA